jgi:NhaP-type Na+/H+ or K+/H+ antiporter
MAIPIHRRITRWITDYILWDTTGTGRQDFWGGLWAARKLLVAIAVSALLTWREWDEHHPPAIALIAIIHFVFVFAAVALIVYIEQWFQAQ